MSELEQSELKRVLCRIDDGAPTIRMGTAYYVIEEDKNRYRIQYENGGSKWFPKSRFVDFIPYRYKI